MSDRMTDERLDGLLIELASQLTPAVGEALNELITERKRAEWLAGEASEQMCQSMEYAIIGRDGKMLKQRSRHPEQYDINYGYYMEAAEKAAKSG